MTTSRRELLLRSALGAAVGILPRSVLAATDGGAVSSFAPDAGQGQGPVVTAQAFAEAETLVQVHLTAAQRALAASNWRDSMAPLLERRTGPRRVALEPTLAPASVWDPRRCDPHPGPSKDSLRRSNSAPPLPKDDADIAFAPLTSLSRWIESRKLSSERLTRIYIARLKRFDPQLHCVITLTEELALEQARKADADLKAGKYHGPLHGIPWGAKDLLDTAGIATTYGAEPFRKRVPTHDAVVVERLRKAGAVLVAKLTLGELALNDNWFGGQTRNPWFTEEGSSGSSAGPGAAVAAGLVGFAVGSETGGSIVSPSARCGVAGLRPTFGRVARTGAMTLCWSLDKLGPMARTAEDTLLVLDAIRGPDADDEWSLPSKLAFDAKAPLKGLKVGYVPAWLKDGTATELDTRALEQLRSLGVEPKEIHLPDWPYFSLDVVLFAEAAASFEELVLDGRIDQLSMKLPDAWPNTMRQSRFLSAVDFVQADRFRRKVAKEMARVMSEVDFLLTPSLRDDMVAVTNATGHPSLTLKTGFVHVSEVRSGWAPDPAHPPKHVSPPRKVPAGVTLVGRLFEEGVLCRVGMELERLAGVVDERPPGF